MFKRITLAALASAAILSSAALSPASAGHPVTGGMHRPGGFFGPRMPGGGMSHPGGFHPGGFHGTALAPWPHGHIALALPRITRTGIGIGVTGYTVRSSSTRAMWLPPTPLRRRAGCDVPLELPGEAISAGRQRRVYRSVHE